MPAHPNFAKAAKDAHAFIDRILKLTDQVADASTTVLAMQADPNADPRLVRKAERRHETLHQDRNVAMSLLLDRIHRLRTGSDRGPTLKKLEMMMAE